MIPTHIIQPRGFPVADLVDVCADFNSPKDITQYPLWAVEITNSPNIICTEANRDRDAAIEQWNSKFSRAPFDAGSV